MKSNKFIAGVIIFFMSTFYSFGEAHPFKITDDDYGKILETTLVSTGNNNRLKKVIDKIKKGDEVHIAAIGGSVTEGAGPAKFTDGYAYQFFRALKAKYAPGEGKNLYFNNAALSGTPSTLGRIRYESDVIEVSGGNPDLLLVEFAVNDGGEELYQWGFESLVRDALLASPDTAVIAVYSAATYGNTMGSKKPVADYYSIPQINMLEIVNSSIEKKIFTKEQYYSDYVHPTIEGHQMMSDALMNLVSKVDKAKLDTPIVVPAKPFKEGLSGLIRINGDDENVKIKAGGFTSIDPNCQTIKKTNKSNFPFNWYRKASSSSDPFKMEITCKKLLFTYKVQGSWMSEKFGKASVLVDGKLVNVYDGGKDGGWNNCETVLLINESVSTKHTVEVRMANGSENKGFTIVAMGYTK